MQEARRGRVQASEKLYKAAEECVRALAKRLGIPETAKAREHGRWYAWLLDKAARRMARELGEHSVKGAWDATYTCGGSTGVEVDLPQVEWLLKYAEETARGGPTARGEGKGG